MPAKVRYLDVLWRLYNRPKTPTPFAYGGNLPWDDPEFGQRMLRYHLSETTSAASRVSAERTKTVNQLWDILQLSPNACLLDVTCGPGLYAVEFAQLGCHVTGVDFAPTSIDYAKSSAEKHHVSDKCDFILQDVRDLDLPPTHFDAAILLYGQLSVMERHESQTLLTRIYNALRPNGMLCVELLDFDRLDKKNNSWWFTDNQGLWGDAPFLHLGERLWLEDDQTIVERFHTLHLDSGRFDEVTLCDVAYPVEEMVNMFRQAGFSKVDVYPHWEKLGVYDADEWIVYIGTK